MAKYSIITLRVTKEEKDLIDSKALQENRTTNNYVRHKLKLKDNITSTRKRRWINNG